MPEKKPEEEKIVEWFGEWFRRRNEKWSKRTKIWFVIMVSFMFVSLLNPASILVIFVYYTFGAVTTLWLIHVTSDEKLTIRKEQGTE